MGRITDLAITQDRLTPFGFGYGLRIHVVDGRKDNNSLQHELVDNLISIVTSCSGKHASWCQRSRG